jgi:prepilin-type processing-associated H-X9-DG protein
VELLIVIGIIAILLSIVLPSIAKARTAAQSAACLANLRNIGQAMILYAMENHGYIPGSGNTSGRHLWKTVGNPVTGAVSANAAWNIETNSPGPNECNDYIFPLANVMGLTELTAGNSGTERFKRYVRAPEFQCPARRQFTSDRENGSSDVGVQPALSYLTALSFLCVPWETYSVTGPGGNGLEGNVTALPPPTAAYVGWTLPAGYVPKIIKVGQASEKIYMADGVKRIRYASSAGSGITGPRYVVSQDPGETTTDRTVFSDHGAFYGASAAYLRQAVPGNATLKPAIDGRIFSYPHGATEGFRPPGSYRLNALFFDGHAESLDDRAAANPALWLPKGTHLNRPSNGAGGSNIMAGVKVVWTDVREQYTGQADWPVGSYWEVP